MNLVLVVVLCLVTVSSALHSEEPHDLDTKHPGHSHDVIEVGAIHKIKDDEFKPVPRDFVGEAPHDHPAIIDDKHKPVAMKPELKHINQINNKPKRKRLNKKPKLVPNKNGKGKGPRKNNKRNNRRRKLNGKNMNKKKNLRPLKRQMRKLPAGAHKSMIERIIAENNSGKGSKLSTKYLKEKIRALLKEEGKLGSKPCKTDKNVKGKKINKRKFMRKLNPKNKNIRKKPRVARKKPIVAKRNKNEKKGKNGLKRKNGNGKKNMVKKIPAKQ